MAEFEIGDVVRLNPIHHNFLRNFSNSFWPPDSCSGLYVITSIGDGAVSIEPLNGAPLPGWGAKLKHGIVPGWFIRDDFLTAVHKAKEHGTI